MLVEYEPESVSCEINSCGSCSFFIVKKEEVMIRNLKVRTKMGCLVLTIYRVFDSGKKRNSGATTNKYGNHKIK